MALILIIEDNLGDARLVQEMLRSESGDYEFITAHSLSEAIDKLSNHSFSLILLDLSLPDCVGIDTLINIKRDAKDIPIVVITGSDDSSLGVKAVSIGAQDYLVKGKITGPALYRAVTYAVERKRYDLERFRRLLNRSNEFIFLIEVPSGKIVDVNDSSCCQLETSRNGLLGTSIQSIVSSESMETMNSFLEHAGRDGTQTDPFESEFTSDIGVTFPVEITLGYDRFEGNDYAVVVARDITERKRSRAELTKSYEMVQQALRGTINAIATTIEIRDPYTAGHQQRVTSLAMAIAENMDLPSQTREVISLAGPIHDIGKIYTPAEILCKPGNLNENEYKIIKTHPQVGYDILKKVEFPWPLARVVLQHHERLDGSGYPNGLSGDEILMEARIIGVADVVETMASHRPYRPALGINAAMDEIKHNCNTLYDHKVVKACIKLFEQDDFKF